MFRLYDFQCVNARCSKQDEPIELLVSAQEIPLCEECTLELRKIQSPIKGYVKGTKTPVSYKSRRK